MYPVPRHLQIFICLKLVCVFGSYADSVSAPIGLLLNDWLWEDSDSLSHATLFSGLINDNN